jgi:arylsulfatase A-like enzyme
MAMNARLLMRTAVAASLLAAASTAAAAAAAPARSAPRPNIVVIMADDQDDSGSLGQMPELGKLAARGVVFTNSFANFSLCCPSRASFLTGQAAHNSGVEGNKLPDGGYQAFARTEADNLGAWLQQAGYRTAVMGKFMNGYGEGDPHARVHVVPGWDEFDVVSDPKGPYRYFGYTLNENGKLVHYGRDAADYQTDVIAAKGEVFIRASTKPFFIMLQPIAPHGVHGDDDDGDADAKGFPEPAPRHLGAFDKLKFRTTANFNEADLSDKPLYFQRQAGDFEDPGVMKASYRRRREAMLAVDDMIKRVVDALTETGQLDNTYIIVTSDNGYSQGAHRWQGKIVLYEESIHVPLVIAGPGVPKGETRDQLVNNLDVTASIVGWSRAKPGRLLDGVDLTPVLRDTSAPWRSAILVENKHEKGVRTKDWLYAESTTDDFGFETELFALDKDPFELKSLAGDDAKAGSATAQLAPLLARLKSCAGASCWAGE